MLDRLLRGRAWIGFLGVLLIGLVALNVSLLKLNAAAGRNAELAKKLRVDNADLQGRVSRLGSGGRLQDAAGRLGLVMPTAGSVHYLNANPAVDARRAARRNGMSPLPYSSDIVSAAPEQPLAPPVAIAPAGTTGAGTPVVGAGAPTGTPVSPAAPASATGAPAGGTTGTGTATGTTGATTQQPAGGATPPPSGTAPGG
jgi:hypothetical protein